MKKLKITKSKDFPLRHNVGDIYEPKNAPKPEYENMFIMMQKIIELEKKVNELIEDKNHSYN